MSTFNEVGYIMGTFSCQVDVVVTNFRVLWTGEHIVRLSLLSHYNVNEFAFLWVGILLTF